MTRAAKLVNEKTMKIKQNAVIRERRNQQVHEIYKTDNWHSYRPQYVKGSTMRIVDICKQIRMGSTGPEPTPSISVTGKNTPIRMHHETAWVQIQSNSILNGDRTDSILQPDAAIR